jgi:hypothetical protein
MRAEFQERFFSVGKWLKIRADFKDGFTLAVK